MMGWEAGVVDIKGAFLHGIYKDRKEVYIEVPEGWDHIYPSESILENF